MKIQNDTFWKINSFPEKKFDNFCSYFSHFEKITDSDPRTFTMCNVVSLNANRMIEFKYYKIGALIQVKHFSILSEYLL